ncbi:MAG: hypothetical protein ACP5NV_05945 [Candidatus Woesearchaeota archaeon]
MMKKIDELVKNEYVRDAGIIAGLTAVDAIVDNVLVKKLPQKYETAVRTVLDLGAITAAFYAGKYYRQTSKDTMDSKTVQNASNTSENTNHSNEVDESNNIREGVDDIES